MTDPRPEITLETPLDAPHLVERSAPLAAAQPLPSSELGNLEHPSPCLKCGRNNQRVVLHADGWKLTCLCGDGASGPTANDAIREWNGAQWAHGVVQQVALNEQQAPPSGGGPAIVPLVMQDLKQREELGIARYGQPLRPFNGRQNDVDLYQELLDAVVYMRARIEEHATPPAAEAIELLGSALAALRMSDEERAAHFVARDWCGAAARFLAEHKPSQEPAPVKPTLEALVEQLQANLEHESMRRELASLREQKTRERLNTVCMDVSEVLGLPREPPRGEEVIAAQMKDLVAANAAQGLTISRWMEAGDVITRACSKATGVPSSVAGEPNPVTVAFDVAQLTQAYRARVDAYSSSLDHVAAHIVHWQTNNPAFQGATLQGTLTHLLKEATEAHRAMADLTIAKADGRLDLVKAIEQDVRVELADVMFMVLQAMRMLGGNLAGELQDKLAINKARTWKAPVGGVVEHASEGFSAHEATEEQLRPHDARKLITDGGET